MPSNHLTHPKLNFLLSGSNMEGFDTGTRKRGRCASVEKFSFEIGFP